MYMYIRDHYNYHYHRNYPITVRINKNFTLRLLERLFYEPPYCVVKWRQEKAVETLLRVVVVTEPVFAKTVPV